MKPVLPPSSIPAQLQPSWRIWFLLLLALWWPLSLKPAGLPEPSLVLYGTVRDVSGGLNVRLTAGTMTWSFQLAGGGPAFTVTTTLTNINGQFSYVVRIPCESPIAGSTASDGTLTLGRAYDRSQVSVDGHPATFVQTGQQSLTLGLADRGRIEEVDLQVTIGGLLPENWQLQYFGVTGIDPLADPDQDGMNNLGEFRSGTNPLDPSSVFAIEVDRGAVGGPLITWSSVAGRSYNLLRSQELQTGFEDLALNIAATPPLNQYQDGSAVAPGPYFYRLLANPSGP